MRNIFLVILLIPIISFAQEKKVSNSFFAGISGTLDFTASIDYERRLFSSTSASLLARVGVEHTIPDRFQYKAYGFPLSLALLFGAKKSHLETSITYVRIKSYGNNVSSTSYGSTDNKAEPNFRATMGYRFQNLFKKGLNFRAGLGKSFYSTDEYDYVSSGSDMTAYFTAGYSF